MGFNGTAIEFPLLLIRPEAGFRATVAGKEGGSGKQPLTRHCGDPEVRPHTALEKSIHVLRKQPVPTLSPRAWQQGVKKNIGRSFGLTIVTSTSRKQLLLYPVMLGTKGLVEVLNLFHLHVVRNKAIQVNANKMGKAGRMGHENHLAWISYFKNISGCTKTCNVIMTF